MKIKPKIHRLLGVHNPLSSDLSKAEDPRINLRTLSRIARDNVLKNDNLVTHAVVVTLLKKFETGLNRQDQAYVYSSFSRNILEEIESHPSFPHAAQLNFALWGSLPSFLRLGEVNYMDYSELVRLAASVNPAIRIKVEAFRRVMIDSANEVYGLAKREGLTKAKEELMQYTNNEREAILHELKRLDPTLCERLALLELN